MRPSRARGVLEFDIARIGDVGKLWYKGIECKFFVQDKILNKIELVIYTSDTDCGESCRVFRREQFKMMSSFRLKLNGLDRAARKMLKLGVV